MRRRYEFTEKQEGTVHTEKLYRDRVLGLRASIGTALLERRSAHSFVGNFFKLAASSELAQARRTNCETVSEER
jgi:hypothetical protein